MTNETLEAKTRLTRKEAALYLTKHHNVRRTHMTLATYASKGGGPVYHKIGRNVFYDRDELDAWVASKTSAKFRSTSHEAEIKRSAI